MDGAASRIRLIIVQQHTQNIVAGQTIHVDFAQGGGEEKKIR